MMPPGGRRKAASLRLHLYPAQRALGQFLDQLMGALFFQVTIGVLGLLDKVGHQVGDLQLSRPVGGKREGPSDHLVEMIPLPGGWHRGHLIVDQEERAPRPQAADFSPVL